MNASRTLLAAVLAHLRAATAVTALVPAPRITAAAPGGLAMPFITISEATATAFDTNERRGRMHLIDIHVWSEMTQAAGGRQGVLDILDAAERALHRASLELDGHQLVFMLFETSRVLPDPDGLTLHGVSSFRAVTEEN